MNNKHLQRTLSILKRTGDKGIIIDGESDELFVLMGVDAYEKMLPAEGVHEPKEPFVNNSTDEFEDYVLDDLIETEERSETSKEIVPVDFELGLKQEKVSVSNSSTPTFEIPIREEKSDNTTEESLADVPHDGEEEEKFYLEPVE